MGGTAVAVEVGEVAAGAGTENAASRHPHNGDHPTMDDTVMEVGEEVVGIVAETLIHTGTPAARAHMPSGVVTLFCSLPRKCAAVRFPCSMDVKSLRWVSWALAVCTLVVSEHEKGCRDGWRGRDRDGADDRGPPRHYERDRRDGFGGGRDSFGGGRGGYGGYDGGRDRDRERDWDGYGRGGRDSPAFAGGDRGGSPPPDEPNKVLSKTMFIKRYIDDDLDDHEIDKRCAPHLATCSVCFELV